MNPFSPSDLKNGGILSNDDNKTAVIKQVLITVCVEWMRCQVNNPNADDSILMGGVGMIQRNVNCRFQ